MASERPPLNPLYPFQYEPLVDWALGEDLGRAGDVTTRALLEPQRRARARILARSPGCVAGLDVVRSVFLRLDPEVRFDAQVRDGEWTERGVDWVQVEGAASALLAAERTALNFLARLSGIATATHRIVEALSGLATRVVCTRKTTPGWRALEKYAVRAGGGWNHRFGLDDGVLIKDNHRALVGCAAETVRLARARVGHMVKIEVEVESLEELEAVLAEGADAVLLDNMDLNGLREAVRIARGRALLEASGGIVPESAREVAETGVDLISVGWITHSAPVLDLSLEVEGRG